MSREFILYTDESSKDGSYFGTFYGGALIRSEDIDDGRETLGRKASELGLTGEVKWQKVSTAYLDRYRALIDGFFDLTTRTESRCGSCSRSGRRSRPA